MVVVIEACVCISYTSSSGKMASMIAGSAQVGSKRGRADPEEKQVKCSTWLATMKNISQIHILEGESALSSLHSKHGYLL